MINPKRRALRFANLNEVMPEVDRLLAGYTTVGSWSLGQICNHLTASLRMSIEGFGVRAPWVVRTTIGRLAKRQVLGSGTMREGIRLPDSFRPKPALDDRAEAEALRAALRVYAAHCGLRAAHPFFGPMTPAEWTRLHCIHSAHHLSFALPKAGA